MADATALPGSLGPLIHRHVAKSSRARFFKIVAGIALAACLISLGFGVWRWYFALTNFGPAVVWRWSWTALLTGVLLGLAALLAAVLAWRQRWPEVYAFRRGLSIHAGQGVARIPWDEIETIYSRSIRYGLPSMAWTGHATVTMHLRDGRRLKLSNVLADYELLIETIKSHIYPGLLARYVHAFNQGQSIAFGPLSLTQQGIQNGRQVLPWNEVQHASLREGKLIVEPDESSRGRRIRLPADKIPNVDLCVQLLQQLGRAS